MPWTPPFLLPPRLLQIFWNLSGTDAGDPIHGSRIARQEVLTTGVLSSTLEQGTPTRDDMSPVKGMLTHSRYPAREEELISSIFSGTFPDDLIFRGKPESVAG